MKQLEKDKDGSRGMKIKKGLKKFGLSALALLLLTAEIIDDSTGLTSMRGKRGIYDFARKLDMGEYSFRQTLRYLEQQGYLEETEEGFLITPKGRKNARIFKMQKPRKAKIDKNWDGLWRIVIFDIPEKLRSLRNIFRSFLKRKGFVRLQNSVFVCPTADFEEINQIRHDLGIEEYVNFLTAKSDALDDDSLLRRHFKNNL